MRSLWAALAALFRVLVWPRVALGLENAALRQQLAVLVESGKRPQLCASDRVFWAIDGQITGGGY